MKLTETMAISCALLAASGCTMIPEYERPVAAIPASFPGSGETAANTAAEIGWEDFFADEQLRVLIGLALENNLDLRVAALRVEQSRAQYRIQDAASYPRVDGSGGLTRSHANGRTTEDWRASIGTTAYEVDFFGRIRSLNRQALEKFLATGEAQRSARISLVAEVATQYFTLVQAQAQLELARQTLASVEEYYDLNKATLEAGAGTELDLRSAESQVETTKVNMLAYERTIGQVANQLAVLVGQSLPIDLTVPRSFDASNLVAEVPAGLPSELLQRRPDILEAEHTLLAANANIGAARAAFFPSLKFTASAGTTSTQFDQLFASGTGMWSFSPQVTIPIFNGGQNRADLDAAKVGKRIEVANYQKTIQTAFREVADALVDNRIFKGQLAARERLAAAQQRRFDLSAARFAQGDTAYLDVLLAQQDLYNARQGYLDTRLNQVVARISLYKALGGGWKSVSL